MAKTFTITVANQAAKLDAKKSGESSFTVNNTSDRALRGQFKVRPLGPAQASWFSLVGEAEREFASRGTQQVTVKIQIPDKTTPGTYTFRLDTISVSNPDDDFTEGPVITVEVPAATAPVTPHGPPSWLWFLIGGIVLVIIIGVVLFLVLHKSGGGKSATVPPDLEHKSLAKVEDTLDQQGIKYDTSPVDALPAEAVSTAVVAAVKPQSGQPLGSDKTVHIILGVPNGLTNKSLTEVISDLGPYGLTVQVAPAGQTSSAGQFTVVGTTPAAGGAIPESKNITLSVASPPAGSPGCRRPLDLSQLMIQPRVFSQMASEPAAAQPQRKQLSQMRALELKSTALQKVPDYMRILCNQ